MLFISSCFPFEYSFGEGLFVQVNEAQLDTFCGDLVVLAIFFPY